MGPFISTSLFEKKTRFLLKISSTVCCIVLCYCVQYSAVYFMFCSAVNGSANSLAERCAGSQWEWWLWTGAHSGASSASSAHDVHRNRAQKQSSPPHSAARDPSQRQRQGKVTCVRMRKEGGSDPNLHSSPLHIQFHMLITLNNFLTNSNS